MRFLKEINDEFQKEVFWISLFDILFFIAPGFLVLFIFYRDLFISLDAIKLILLALSISVPFVVLNAIFVGLLQSIYAKTKNSEDNMFICATISLFFTNIFFE